MPRCDFGTCIPAAECYALCQDSSWAVPHTGFDRIWAGCDLGLQSVQPGVAASHHSDQPSQKCFLDASPDYGECPHWEVQERGAGREIRTMHITRYTVKLRQGGACVQACTD